MSNKTILHLDLKPSNVMVVGGPESAADEQSLRIIDFGSFGSDSGDLQIGTLEYMAPDRHRAGCAANSTWDIFSLGSILYFLITGGHPPLGPDRNPHFDVERIRDDTLRKIFRKATARESADRYRSAGDLAADFHAWLEDYPTLNAGVPYTLADEWRLLARRCRARDNEWDHSRLIALAFFVMAGSAFLFSTLGTALNLAGVDWNIANWSTAVPFIVITLIAMVSIAWVTRFRHTTRRMVTYQLAFVFAALVIRLQLAPNDAAQIASFQFLLTGLAVTYMGLANRLWSIWTWIGGAALICSPIFNVAARQSWYAPFDPVAQGWLLGFVELAFACKFYFETAQPKVREFSVAHATG
jgi:hypothetical protein